MDNTTAARPTGQEKFLNNNSHLDSNVYTFKYSPNGGVRII